MKRWGGNYWALGPYREGSARVEFEPMEPDGPIAAVVEELRTRDTAIHVGRWLVTGRPRTVLIDYTPVLPQLNERKYFYWKDCGISLPPSDRETDDVVAFGFWFHRSRRQ